MRRSQLLLQMAACAVAFAPACTGGFILRQDGSQWTPSTDGSPLASGVVTFSNSGGTYQVWTKPSGSFTEFSFDPYASNLYTGNYETNESVYIPQGTYTVTVAADHVWQATNVSVENVQTCPYADEYTGQANIDCQLFQFVLLNCAVAPVAPYKSGNVTVVQLTQQNSGQCGPRTCPHDVQDVKGQFVTNPDIAEVYVSCSLDAPGGCTQAPNTGLWSSLANSTPFWSRMVEYGAGSGSYAGASTLNELITESVMSDSDVESLLPAAIAAGYVKAAPSPALYVIYLPSTSCAGQCDGTSHHWQFKGSDGQLYNVALIAGYGDPQTQNSVAAHEVEEAVTDPNDYDPGCGTNTGCGWNEPSTHEGEIADLCGSAGNDVIEGFDVAKVWSQAQCRCL